jgi:hypothetical protein
MGIALFVSLMGNHVTACGFAHSKHELTGTVYTSWPGSAR